MIPEESVEVLSTGGSEHRSPDGRVIGQFFFQGMQESR